MTSSQLQLHCSVIVCVASVFHVKGLKVSRNAVPGPGNLNMERSGQGRSQPERSGGEGRTISFWRRGTGVGVVAVSPLLREFGVTNLEKIYTVFQKSDANIQSL